MAMRDLVLLPGWDMPAQVLYSLIPWLQDRYRVTVLDLPPGDSLSVMASAALSRAPTRAGWFGWSLGGMVATQAALLAPARVSALATLATNLAFVARDDWRPAMPASVFAAFRAEFAADPVAARRRFLSLQVQGSATPRRDLRTLRDLAGGADPAVALAALDVLGQADLRAGARQLAVPSLWLYGENDALVPVAVAADVVAGTPGAKVALVTGAGHAPFLHDAQQVANLIAPFFSEYP